ncbi:MAG: DUF4336 domain-containing protein [Oligoflexales bacterium]
MKNEALLTEFGKNIWIVEGELVSFFGFPYPTRSVIVKLASSDLWVWSPIALSDSLKNELQPLGTVKHLVSPNKMHHLYLQDWLKEYPNAQIWGPRSTIKKRGDLAFSAPLIDEAPSDWKDEIDQFWINGSFAIDELVFFHKDTKTAIIADLSQNFSEDFLDNNWSWWKRKFAYFWGITEPNGSAPLEMRLTWYKKHEDRSRLKRLMTHNPENIIMAHGECLKGGGMSFISNSFRWLL